MIKTCPSCNKLPNQNDYIECATEKCEEFEVKYLTHEWQQLPRDLEQLAKLEQEFIDDDPNRDRGIPS